MSSFVEFLIFSFGAVWTGWRFTQALKRKSITVDDEWRPAQTYRERATPLRYWLATVVAFAATIVCVIAASLKFRSAIAWLFP